ncbi:MAG TPA: alpha/beta fold hydrolase [Paracoccus sp.]|nr:alpha/beta fold hydrolase [Paracoccus sp. (in: a-proteobacteria)]
MAGRATSNGIDIYYEVHGDLRADATPVLLLHGGMGAISTDFAALLPALTPHYAVIGLEQQGHGHTAGREAPITLSSMRADTLAVMDHLEIEKAHVIGFSMGGMLALDLGLHAPERLATLTALSVSQNVEGMHPEIVAINRDPSATPSPEIAAILPSEDDFAKLQAAFADNPSGPDQFQRSFVAMNAFINSGWGWSDAQLEPIPTPSLLVVGDNDFMPVAHVARMAALIPDSHFAAFPDTLHTTMTSRTDWILTMFQNRIAASVE